MSDLFGDFEAPPGSAGTTGGESLAGNDPQLDANDLLAREQALLGDDAALFSTGLTGSADAAAAFPDLDAAPHAIVPSFAPAMPLAPVVAPMAAAMAPPTPTASALPASADSGAFAPASGLVQLGAPETEEEEAEPEALAQWKAEFQERVAALDRASERKHEAILKKAKDDLERFYAEYEEQKRKQHARAAAVADGSASGNQDLTSAKGTPWEKVYRYIDVAPPTALQPASPSPNSGVNLSGPAGRSKEAAAKASAAAAASGKETARMKALLQSLKSDASAPCSAGKV